MANLTRKYRWEKWAPDIGENLELPEPERLWLEVASGLSKMQLLELADAQRKVEFDDRVKMVAGLAAAYSPFVRVVGSNTVGGEQVNSLEQLLSLMCDAGDMGTYFVREMAETLMTLNSIGGSLKLFSARRSGGGATTVGRSAAKEESKTEGR